jgi:damage-control phosphatase, subfamily I
MKIALDCMPCIIKNYQKLLNLNHLSEMVKVDAMKQLLAFLANADFNQSPPVLGREIHRMIRQTLGDSDPYRDIKVQYNQLILDMYADLHKKVVASKNPFYTALKLAVAGNAIDFGSQHQPDVMQILKSLEQITPAIDDSEYLRRDLKYARNLLYIGDNCGEIVFDKLFLENIAVPTRYFAVRGGPVVNDVTHEDAIDVGMDTIAAIITSGDDSPGTVWDSSSAEFKGAFNNADVIIAKGQGNYEGLSHTPGNIYFLFIVKCDLIARQLGAQPGDFIIQRKVHNDR